MEEKRQKTTTQERLERTTRSLQYQPSRSSAVGDMTWREEQRKDRKMQNIRKRIQDKEGYVRQKELCKVAKDRKDKRKRKEGQERVRGGQERKGGHTWPMLVKAFLFKAGSSASCLHRLPVKHSLSSSARFRWPCKHC